MTRRSKRCFINNQTLQFTKKLWGIEEKKVRIKKCVKSVLSASDFTHFLHSGSGTDIRLYYSLISSISVRFTPATLRIAFNVRYLFFNLA